MCNGGPTHSHVEFLGLLKQTNDFSKAVGGGGGGSLLSTIAKKGAPHCQPPCSLVIVSALQTPFLTSCMFQLNGLEKAFMEPH